MCGIVGYAGHRQAQDVVLEGLSRLEYRGYDSAGMAVIDNGKLAWSKRAGKLGNLKAALAERPPLAGTVGLGHTRWATHGPPTDPNAHPHTDASGTIALYQGWYRNSSTFCLPATFNMTNGFEVGWLP